MARRSRESGMFSHQLHKRFGVEEGAPCVKVRKTMWEAHLPAISVYVTLILTSPLWLPSVTSLNHSKHTLFYLAS